MFQWPALHSKPGHFLKTEMFFSSKLRENKCYVNHCKPPIFWKFKASNLQSQVFSFQVSKNLTFLQCLDPSWYPLWWPDIDRDDFSGRPCRCPRPRPQKALPKIFFFGFGMIWPNKWKINEQIMTNNLKWFRKSWQKSEHQLETSVGQLVNVYSFAASEFGEKHEKAEVRETSPNLRYCCSSSHCRCCPGCGVLAGANASFDEVGASLWCQIWPEKTSTNWNLTNHRNS